MIRTNDDYPVFTSASAAIASLKADKDEQGFLFVQKGGPYNNVKLRVRVQRTLNKGYEGHLDRHNEKPDIYSLPSRYTWIAQVMDLSRQNGYSSYSAHLGHYDDFNRLKEKLRPFLSRNDSQKVARNLLWGDSFKETTMDAKETWALTQDMMYGQFRQANVLDDSTKLEISKRIYRLMQTDAYPEVESLNAGISMIPVSGKDVVGGFSYMSAKGRINVEYSWSYFLGRCGGTVTVSRQLPGGKMNTATKIFRNPKDIGSYARSLERIVALDSASAGLTADSEPVQVWTADFSGKEPRLVKDAEWGVYSPGELVKIERRRDALWRKEDDGSLTAAEKSELADLQKKLAKHYAKLKADRKKAGFKDAKDPKQMTEQEIKAELRAIHERIGKRHSVPEKEVESHRAEWKAENERSEALQKELDRRWATKDADFHTEVGKGASARREAFKLAEQKTIESYNKTRPGKQFSIWAVYQSGTGVYSIGPGKSGYKGEKEDKTYQEWKSRPLFLTGKERKEFQAGRYPASAKEQLKKERAQGISDTKDEMSIVADMLNGKFANDAYSPMYPNANAAASALQDKKQNVVYYQAQDGRTVLVNVERVTQKSSDYVVKSYRLWIAYVDGAGEDRIWYQYYPTLGDVKKEVRMHAR